jgi:hypothetical protein
MGTKTKRQLATAFTSSDRPRGAEAPERVLAGGLGAYLGVVAVRFEPDKLLGDALLGLFGEAPARCTRGFFLLAVFAPDATENGNTKLATGGLRDGKPRRHRPEPDRLVSSPPPAPVGLRGGLGGGGAMLRRHD